MANIASLKPFPKGVSGNPTGRPKGALSLTTRVREALEQACAADTDFADELTKVVMQKALEGNEQMIKLVWSYVDGQPKQENVIESKAPIVVQFIEPTYERFTN